MDALPDKELEQGHPGGPPPIPLRLLELFLSPEHDTLIGDMEEAWDRRIDQGGCRRANARFWLDALLAIPYVLIHDFLWFPAMLKNYVRITARLFARNKVFSAINVFGLAVSLAACLLIISVVKEQKAYDTFHEQSNALYRVTTAIVRPYGPSELATSPGPLAAALASESPFVDETVRMSRFDGHLGVDQSALAVRGLYAEPAFFDLFSFPLAQGGAESALVQPNSVVLTQETAQALFPDSDALGQVLMHDGVEFQVTGVLEPVPKQTHLRFDVLISFTTLSGPGLDDWENTFRFYTYLRTTPGANPQDLAGVATRILSTNDTSEDRPPATAVLQPVQNINMGAELSNQIATTVPVMLVVALTILGLLLIGTAAFNYMTLSVARSLKRSREIGIRKVVGASRGQLFRQFVSEAVFMSCLALVAALVILVWLVPAFNSLDVVRDELGIAVNAGWNQDIMLFGLFVGLALVVGVLAGMYPAAILSRFVPVHVLKGQANVGGLSSSTMRKVLVVCQFTVAITGIVVTLVVNNQFAHLMTKDYGFDESGIVHIELHGQSYERLRPALMAVDGVENVAGTTVPLVVGGNWKTNFRTSSMEDDALIRFYSVDNAFVDMYRTRILAGRNFMGDVEGGEPNQVLINEMALPVLGFASPDEAVGRTFTLSDSLVTVAGVVRDFTLGELASDNEATILTNAPTAFRYAVVRVEQGRAQEALAGLTAAWHRMAPTFQFDYGFFDDELQARMGPMRDVMGVVGVVVMFIVFIACLGLLGMAGYATEARIREVGIRKVLGADARNVVLLLSRDFLVLVLVAAAIGLPAAWFLSNAILQEFADRIPLHAGYFATGFLLTLLLALLTVGSQTLRAGRLNPVEALRVD